MNISDVTGVVAAVALAISAGTLAAQGMSKDDYKAAQNSIAAEYKSARAECGSRSGNAKDVCMAEAKGKEKVAKAELEARNKPSEKARYAVSIAKAEADYAVAKEKCDDKAGNEKKACVQEAKAAETHAKADAKAQLKSADAGQPAKEKSAAPASKKESAGEYIDDAVITAKVKEAVLEEPSLKSAEINVETSQGNANIVVLDKVFSYDLRESLRRAMRTGTIQLTKASWHRQALWRKVPIWLAYTVVRVLLGMVGYAERY